jgi:S1-C subfamily serine protease
LIGLNVAVFREGQGIGFAIPVKRLSEAVSSIFTPEQVKSLWLGSRFKASPAGVVTTSVEPGSPADKAGLRSGDVVLKVNDQTPQTPIELNREILVTGEKRDLRLQIQRQHERRTLTLRLIPEKEVFNAALFRQKLGATVQDLTPEAAAQMNLGPSDGLLVSAVEKNGPAAEAGLARGNVIRALDGQALESVPQAAKLLYRRKSGDKVELTVIVAQVRGRFLRIYPAKATVSVR